MRQFEAGDPVLVLLPTAASKLLAQWQGPYQVVMRLGKVSYLVDMHDKRKRRRVIHNNMLKEFRVRKPVETSFLVESEPADDIDETDMLLWDDSPEGRPTTGGQLSDSQRQQLGNMLEEFSDVMENQPGHTCANPVRLPPYRLPHGYRETVQSGRPRLFW